MFSQHTTIHDFWLYEGSPSQSMESLLSQWKKLTDFLPTRRRQPHLTTYQLLVMQTLCGVQRAASEFVRLYSYLSLA